jgi:hypothetical protein
MISLNMTATLGLLATLSTDRAALLAGRHGIGKSEAVYQAAARRRNDLYKDIEVCKGVTARLGNDPGFARGMKNWLANNELPADYPANTWHYEMGVPVIERRLSQMTEGDICGLPFEGGWGGTVFRAVEWLTAGVEYPVVLFLDELNRAIKGVEQATFQLADSKAFDGVRLHKGTQVIVACNIGNDYEVSTLDPAALSRYASVELRPSVDEFVTYARSKGAGVIAGFIASNPGMLESDKSQSWVKTPDRRAWLNLHGELVATGLYATPEVPVFMHLCGAMLGQEAAAQFARYATDALKDVTAEEVLADWSSAKARVENGSTDEVHVRYIDVACKLENYIAKKVLTDAEARNYAGFFNDAPAEVSMKLWTALITGKSSSTTDGVSMPNMMKVKPLVSKKIFNVTNSGKNVAKG